MMLQQLINACGLESVLVPEAQAPVTGAYTSDLLSDVIAHCPEGAVLITVQNHSATAAAAKGETGGPDHF